MKQSIDEENDDFEGLFPDDSDDDDDDLEEKTENEESSGKDLRIVPEMRMLTLYGDVSEKKGNEIVYSLFAYKEVKKIVPKDNNLPPKDFDLLTEPLDFLISTNGGNAADMFAIYDTMKFVQNDMEIHTMGIGKVMSAGVLLLAAGTKGKRKIGKNCRVMIHAVIAGAAGASHTMADELEEIMKTQEKYIQCLSDETNMTVKQIKKLLDERKNIYLTAEEAIKYGIADLIL